ncbi:Glycosyltransferase involved in cell wall bisynthesis [[Luteovulum] sphaeroides subsp. megalophilum]|nr:Glycosyltransferase involved in cell wall bisynthesis [[Luteovulum] sphaeroides subsp. megalophilum]
MIGYGELLLKAARSTGRPVQELRPASPLGRLLPSRVSGLSRKLANNLDRFFVGPLSLLARKTDTVHVVDPGNVVYLPFIRHRRSIVTVHDMIPYLAGDGKLTGWKPTATGRWLMRRILAQLAKVDHIVCVSEVTRRDLLAYVDIPPERVSVILNAVFQPIAPTSPEACSDLRQRIGVPQDAPLVMHIGRNWYKNREMVLQVAAHARQQRPDLKLVMVGALTSDQLALAEQLELGDNLIQIDRIAAEDIATLYTAADVLLFPSWYEGFGLPVLEARMCGTPVVCSDAGSLPEVAEGCSTCAPTDKDGLTQAVLSALSERPPRACLRKFDAGYWMDSHLRLYAALN